MRTLRRLHMSNCTDFGRTGGGHVFETNARYLRRGSAAFALNAF